LFPSEQAEFVAWNELIAREFRLLALLPWKSVRVLSDSEGFYEVAKSKTGLVFTSFVISPGLPLVNLVVADSKIIEWSTQFKSVAINDLLTNFMVTDFTVSGFPFTGAIYSKDNYIDFKLSWSGGVLPILSKSSCRSLIQENKDISHLTNENMNNQLELTLKGSQFQIKKWIAQAAEKSYQIKGSWSNEQVSCELEVITSNRSQKNRYDISLK
jgi:hypothetical protein